MSVLCFNAKPSTTHNDSPDNERGSDIHANHYHSSNKNSENRGNDATTDMDDIENDLSILDLGRKEKRKDTYRGAQKFHPTPQTVSRIITGDKTRELDLTFAEADAAREELLHKERMDQYQDTKTLQAYEVCALRRRILGHKDEEADMLGMAVDHWSEHDNHKCEMRRGRCLVSFRKDEVFTMDIMNNRTEYLATGDVFLCSVFPAREAHICTPDQCTKISATGTHMACGYTGRIYGLMENEYDTLDSRSKVEFNTYGSGARGMAQSLDVLPPSAMMRPKSSSGVVFHHPNRILLDGTSERHHLVYSSPSIGTQGITAIRSVRGMKRALVVRNDDDGGIASPTSLAKEFGFVFAFDDDVSMEDADGSVGKSGTPTGAKRKSPLKTTRSASPGRSSTSSSTSSSAPKKMTKRGLLEQKHRAMSRSMRNEMATQLLWVLDYGDSRGNSEMLLEIEHFAQKCTLTVRNFENEMRVLYDMLGQSNAAIPNEEGNFFINIRNRGGQNMTPITIVGAADGRVLAGRHGAEDMAFLNTLFLVLSDITKNVELMTLPAALRTSMLDDSAKSTSNALTGDDDFTATHSDTLKRIEYRKYMASLRTTIETAARGRYSRVHNNNFASLTSLAKRANKKKGMGAVLAVLLFSFLESMHTNLYNVFYVPHLEKNGMEIVVLRLKAILYNRYHIQTLAAPGAQRFYLTKDVFALYEKGLLGLYHDYQKQIAAREMPGQAATTSATPAAGTHAMPPAAGTHAPSPAGSAPAPARNDIYISTDAIDCLRHIKYENMEHYRTAARNIIFQCLYLSRIYNRRKHTAEMARSNAAQIVHGYIKKTAPHKTFTLLGAWVEYARPTFTQSSNDTAQAIQTAERLMASHREIERYTNVILRSWKTLVLGSTSLSERNASSPLNNALFEKHCIAVIYTMDSGFVKEIRLDRDRIAKDTGVVLSDRYLTMHANIIPASPELKQALVHLTHLGHVDASMVGFIDNNEIVVAEHHAPGTESGYQKWYQRQKRLQSSVYDASDHDLRNLPSLLQERDRQRQHLERGSRNANSSSSSTPASNNKQSSNARIQRSKSEGNFPISRSQGASSSGGATPPPDKDSLIFNNSISDDDGSSNSTSTDDSQDTSIYMQDQMRRRGLRLKTFSGIVANGKDGILNVVQRGSGRTNASRSVSISRSSSAVTVKTRYSKRYCRSTKQSLVNAYTNEIGFCQEILYHTLEHIARHYDRVAEKMIRKAYVGQNANESSATTLGQSANSTTTTTTIATIVPGDIDSSSSKSSQSDDEGRSTMTPERIAAYAKKHKEREVKKAVLSFMDLIKNMECVLD